MQTSFTTMLMAVVCYIGAANAHILLSTPAPYPGSISSPLTSGLAFPCQGKTSGGTPTPIKLGSKNNKIAFKGSAVHKGGSCQVSISYDSTTWKVITSIHGGCPMDNPAGNLPANAENPLDTGLTFDVPSNIPNGPAKFAWTWFNKEGNREMYMNCAPIMLDGAGGDKKNFDSLPDMVVTNIAGRDDCTVDANVDYAFPNPGKVVKVGLKDPKTLVTMKCKGGQSSSTPAAPAAPATPGVNKPLTRRSISRAHVRDFAMN